MNLFTPIVDQERLHPSFRSIVCERNRYALDVLQDWARGFQDRDGKFVKEFQTSFEPAFWELYLHAVLKHYRLVVDFQHNRPDFVITEPYHFSMEATVALNDDQTTPIHGQKAEDIPDDLNKFNEEAIVRLSNSFSSKLEKYRNSYSSLGHVRNKPFVLALAPFDRPFANLQAQRTIAFLFNSWKFVYN